MPVSHPQILWFNCNGMEPRHLYFFKKFLVRVQCATRFENHWSLGNVRLKSNCWLLDMCHDVQFKGRKLTGFWPWNKRNSSGMFIHSWFWTKAWHSGPVAASICSLKLATVHAIGSKKTHDWSWAPVSGMEQDWAVFLVGRLLTLWITGCGPSPTPQHKLSTKPSPTPQHKYNYYKQLAVGVAVPLSNIMSCSY